MKRKHVLLQLIIILFLSITTLCLLGRDHFIFGTVLGACRWVFICLCAILFYISLKRRIAAYFTIMIAVTSSLILLEFISNKFHEHRLQKTTTNTELSIMTYNVLFTNKSLKSSIRKIEKHSPDILLIQELTPAIENQLDNSIGKDYPYKKTLALEGIHGIGVYSKYQITQSQLLNNQQKLPFAQVLDIIVISKKIQITNVHLASPAIAVENPYRFLPLLAENYEERAKQIQKIETIMQTGDYHAQIITGDLNTMPYEPIFRNLKNSWVNLFNVVGKGSPLTFPNTSKIAPLITLDYILLRGNAQVKKAKVIQGGGSDHLPIVGEIEI